MGAGGGVAIFLTLTEGLSPLVKAKQDVLLHFFSSKKYLIFLAPPPYKPMKLTTRRYKNPNLVPQISTNTNVDKNVSTFIMSQSYYCGPIFPELYKLDYIWEINDCDNTNSPTFDLNEKTLNKMCQKPQILKVCIRLVTVTELEMKKMKRKKHCKNAKLPSHDNF